MRLSTDTDRDDARGVAVIHAALDAGATLLDTADAYCLDDRDVGHNERLVATALSTWPGDRARITVATKGGMRRPKGAWAPDGRAKHLREACEGSRRALGVDTIDLYQLHVVDPKTPLETSMRALARLQEEGRIGALHDWFYTTTGNGTPVATSVKFGQEIADELKEAGVEAVVLSGT